MALLFVLFATAMLVSNWYQARLVVTFAQGNNAADTYQEVRYIQTTFRLSDVGVGTISPVGGDGSIITGEEAELQVVALKTKTFAPNSKGETGKLTGKGILLPGPVVGSCRWKFARVDPDPVPLDADFCLNAPN